MNAVPPSAPTDRSESDVHLYLVYSGQSAPVDGWKMEGSVFRASPHTCLVRTTLSRSRVYHAVKRQMRSPAPLMVAPLSADPKFKDMAPGTLTWLRRTEPSRD